MGDLVNRLATNKAYRMNCEITLSVLLVVTNHISNFGSPESEQTQTELHVVASTFFASELCRRRELIDETSHTQNAALLQLKSKTSVATGRRASFLWRRSAHQNSSPHHVKFQNESGAGARSNDMRMLWLQKAC